ncbi:hypothetical protein FI667_g395, partial [Globisporangium splendens]
MPLAPSSDSSTGNDFEMELVDSSTPSPTPPPRASADSTTFRLVPTMPCNQTVAATTVQVYTKNRALFEECVGKAKYQIFPFSGVLPTPAQITMQAIVPACTAIFTGILLLGIPQCDVGSMPLKSVSETLLKVTVDIRSGLPCPDSQQFFNLIVWRRDSNLAQDAGLPYDSGSELYAEYTRNLWKSLTTYNVHVGSDLTIGYDGDGLDGDASGSASDATGASKVGSTSSQPASTPSLSPRAGTSEATTSTLSGATTIFEPRTATFMTVLCAFILWMSPEIPPVVYKHTKLTELYLSRNRDMAEVTLTNEQANFIYMLTKFTIDAAALRTDCSASQKITIHGYTICIKGGAKNESIIKRSRAAALSSGSETMTSSTAPEYSFASDTTDYLYKVRYI